MSRIARNTETIRLDLDGDDWIDIKKSLTMGDQQAVRSATAKMKLVPKNGHHGKRKRVETEAVIDTAAGNMTMLLRSIVGWGGPGFCTKDHDVDKSPHDENGDNGCVPLPVSAHNIDLLDAKTGELLVEKINEQNPTATTDEEDEEENP